MAKICCSQVGYLQYPRFAGVKIMALRKVKHSGKMYLFIEYIHKTNLLHTDTLQYATISVTALTSMHQRCNTTLYGVSAHRMLVVTTTWLIV